MKNLSEIIEQIRIEQPDRCEAIIKAEAEAITRFACCSKARLRHCVCMYHFVCPDHGKQHIGTHD